MNLPNPYEHKHYKLLMALPLALLAIALFLVFVSPGIPRGIDLKGGTLVSLQTTQESVNTEQLKTALLQYSKNVDVRRVSTPSGTGLEIELESSAALEEAEGKLESILSLDRQLAEAEVLLGTALANNQSGEPYGTQASDLKARLSSELNLFYQLVGSATRVDANSDLHQQASNAQKEFTDAREKQREAVLAEIRSLVKVDAYSFKEIGSSLSKFFLEKTREVVIYSLLLVAIVMFLIFRSLFTSFAAIFGAVANVAITGGAMALLGIPFTLATIASLLMLIGFSLDTEIMLNTRLVKRKEANPQQALFETMKTGTLMNLATIGAFGALLVLALWLQIPTYSQIGSVVAIGGVVDFFVTWFFGAPFLLWHLSSRKHSGQ